MRMNAEQQSPLAPPAMTGAIAKEAAKTAGAEKQFVTLNIDREIFAIPVDGVHEILDMQPVFRIPEAPAYMMGLIDWRGRSVPVLDLRAKLGLPSIPPTPTTRILVLEVSIAGLAAGAGARGRPRHRGAVLQRGRDRTGAGNRRALAVRVYQRRRPSRRKLRHHFQPRQAVPR